VILHVNVQDFVEKLFEVIVAQSLEQLFDILRYSQLEPPLLVV
jgi:hypothetical protein